MALAIPAWPPCAGQNHSPGVPFPGAFGGAGKSMRGTGWGCGLGAQPPSRGPFACWEEAEQVTGVQSRSRAAARPGGWTALLKPALTPERLTGQGGSLSASQLYPRLSAPQLIRRSLAMGLPSDSSIFSPQAPLPPSLPTIWLPTLHTLDMPLPCPPPSRDPIA